MLKKPSILQNAIVEAFDQLYHLYHDEAIYGCVLILNEYLHIDSMMVSTVSSVFNDDEDAAQFLPQEECWNTSKWRYRSQPTPLLNQANLMLRTSTQGLNVLSAASMETATDRPFSNLDSILTAFHGAIQHCTQQLNLERGEILFFIHMPTQPAVEPYSAQTLNPGSILLPVFLQHKAAAQASQASTKLKKLSQADKDLLVDLAQIATNEPYYYLNVANQAYILMLDSRFSDVNPYIQKLVKAVAAMMDSDEMVAMTRAEILERIDQFYSGVMLQR